MSRNTTARISRARTYGSSWSESSFVFLVSRPDSMVSGDFRIRGWKCPVRGLFEPSQPSGLETIVSHASTHSSLSSGTAPVDRAQTWYDITPQYCHPVIDFITLP